MDDRLYIPHELWEYILSYLPQAIEDLLPLRLVCKGWEPLTRQTIQSLTIHLYFQSLHHYHNHVNRPEISCHLGTIDAVEVLSQEGVQEEYQRQRRIQIDRTAILSSRPTFFTNLNKLSLILRCCQWAEYQHLFDYLPLFPNLDSFNTNSTITHLTIGRHLHIQFEDLLFNTALTNLLPQLLHLDLSHNSVGMKSYDTKMTQLTRLTSLNLASTSIISGAMFELIMSLTRLQTLNMDNAVRIIIPPGFGTALQDSLTELHLCGVTPHQGGSLAKEVCSLTRLTKLSIAYTQLATEGNYRALSRLVDLSAVGSFKGGLPEQLTQGCAGSLQTLRISIEPVIENEEALRRLTALTHLTLIYPKTRLFNTSVWSMEVPRKAKICF